ncbi:MAG: ATPase [Rhodobacteraceae bacterium]|nr:ATPase [Paracoccaceae bacterium]
MSDWAAKRFWKDTSVVEVGDGWTVHLDTRCVRTPAKAALTLPTRPMAEAIAAEWAAQDGLINPLTMPVTRAANAAIDKVAPQRAEVAAMIAAYGETDLLSHRAEGPAELVARQATAWDPLLDWAAQMFGARLGVGAGIMPLDHPPEALRRLADAVATYDPFELTALHDLVSLTGSLIIGLATLHGVQPSEALWQAGRIDEDWQIEQWGRDDLADAEAAIRRTGFLQAIAFFHLTQRY